MKRIKDMNVSKVKVAQCEDSGTCNNIVMKKDERYYKDEIIEMVNRIDSSVILRYIYGIVNDIVMEEGI
jgi:hypothetical protein